MARTGYHNGGTHVVRCAERSTSKERVTRSVLRFVSRLGVIYREEVADSTRLRIGQNLVGV